MQILLLVAFLATFNVNYAQRYGSNIVDVKPEDFHGNEGVLLVEFHNPTSPTIPTLDAIAATLKGVVRVVSCDVTANPNFAENNGLRLYSGGEDSALGVTSLEEVISEALNAVNLLVQKRMPKPKTKPKSKEEKKFKPSKKSSANFVVELSEKNFNEVLNESSDPFLVAFVAPWCGHCKKLEPEFEEAAKELSSGGVDVKLGLVDATQNERLSSEYNVKGFPTIKLFKNGKAEDYQGSREKAGIVNFMLSLAGPPKVLQLTSQEKFDLKCDGDARICLVAFLPHILDTSADGRKKELDMLGRVAKDLMGARVSVVWVESGAQSDLQNVLLGESWSSFPAAAVLSTGKAVSTMFMGAWTESKIKKFANPGSKYNGLQKLSSPLSVIKQEEWDGQDAELEFEEEFSLSDLMGDEDL